MYTASFKVKMDMLKAGSRELRQYRNMICSANRSIEETIYVISRMRGSVVLTSNYLRKIRGRVDVCAGTADSMAQKLEEIAGLYGNTEKVLSGYGGKSSKAHAQDSSAASDKENKSILEQLWGWICRLFGWDADSDDGYYEIDSVVFDDEGSYGGDQGSPASRLGKRDLYDIVRKHFPEMSDRDIANFLNKLNSEGCSYVGTINTIFAAYEGKDADFERMFGFPMYKDGDLNYDELLVDFYCETDNHNINKKGQDYVDASEDESEKKGSGATLKQQIYRAEKYLESKGVNVDISSKEITVNNFKQYSKNGYVVIDYYNGPLQGKDGNVEGIIDGGHAMTVTGVTDDGRFIVSSWGKKYYLDPNQGDCSFLYYQYH